MGQNDLLFFADPLMSKLSVLFHAIIQRHEQWAPADNRDLQQQGDPRHENPKQG